MNGWRYEWVDALPGHVYDLLVEMLNRDHAHAHEDQIEEPV
jgi:hypothetical protein